MNRPREVFDRIVAELAPLLEAHGFAPIDDPAEPRGEGDHTATFARGADRVRLSLGASGRWIALEANEYADQAPAQMYADVALHPLDPAAADAEWTRATVAALRAELLVCFRQFAGG